MTSLAIPQKLSVNNTNRALCAQIGVRLDGRDLGKSVRAYDVQGGAVTLLNGQTLVGKVEPYWRGAKAAALRSRAPRDRTLVYVQFHGVGVDPFVETRTAGTLAELMDQIRAA